VAKDSARFRGVLIVEDTEGLAKSLSEAFRAIADEVVVARTVAEAMAALAEEEHHHELVVTDVRLPDGSGLDVAARALSLQPMPLVVAMSGEATPEESFALARSGVHAYVQKPLSFASLLAALERAAVEKPPLGPHVRAAVGKVPLHELEEDVRAMMVDEALARSDGSRRGAARLLAVSRQLMQHILRK
jgi:two-component system, response regulator RegA